ncbi:MAG: hypothetical protein Tsb002_22680 [Wenzhouxiangellaceae bacterium]
MSERQKIDDVVRAALQQEDRELFDQLSGDMGLQEMALETFRGKQRWIKSFGFVLTLVLFGCMLYCLWNMFQTEAIRELILWAAGFMYCAMAVGLLKLYFWMEFHKSAVLREIKRVELQVSRLVQQPSPPTQ